jgi:phage FluMu gp28-like protein
MCVPADDATAFLPYDLIAGCQLRHPDDMTIETEETRDFTGRKGQIRTFSGPYSLGQIALMPWPVFVGVDIGRRRDLTVLWCAARIAGLLTPLFIVEMASVEFARQELELYRLLDLPNCLRACIDQTGIGNQFAERAAKSYGIYKAEGITFTNAVKEQLAYPVRLGFEDRSLRIPSDELVISDLRAIRKETTASGAIRFSADRGPNGHADRFWALALARHAAAAAEEFGPLSVVSRPRREIRSEYDGYMPGRAIRSLVDSY